MIARFLRVVGHMTFPFSERQVDDLSRSVVDFFQLLAGCLS
jgi:hypothetical protein